jgi:hypothetical protein
MDAVLVQRLYYFLPSSIQTLLLAEALRVLRPGGRLIMVDPSANQSPAKAVRELPKGIRSAVDMMAWHLAAQEIGGVTPESIAERLADAGYARILAERVLNGWGVLSRGEKPYPAGATTAERVAVGANTEQADGRYIHLLIRQSPNKAVWALTESDVITWGAAAVLQPEPTALAFTSLPKAVAFMQEAVLQGTLEGITKVAKFKKDKTWDFPIVVNPTAIEGEVTFIGVDPDEAEAPDE